MAKTQSVYPAIQFLKTYPVFKSGIDFSKGFSPQSQTWDPAVLYGAVQKPDTTTSAPTSDTSSTQVNVPDSSTAVPSVAPAVQQQIDYLRLSQPYLNSQFEQMLNMQLKANEQNIRLNYPYLSAAAEEAAERSKRMQMAYRGFTEGLPSSQSARATEAQARMQSAQGGEAALMNAIANQAAIARDFGAIRYAGPMTQIA